MLLPLEGAAPETIRRNALSRPRIVSVKTPRLSCRSASDDDQEWSIVSSNVHCILLHIINKRIVIIKGIAHRSHHGLAATHEPVSRDHTLHTLPAGSVRRLVV